MINTILTFKLNCNECHNIEFWSILEFEYVGDYPYECDKCHNDEMDITLINK